MPTPLSFVVRHPLAEAPVAFSLAYPSTQRANFTLDYTPGYIPRLAFNDVRNSQLLTLV